MTVRIDVHRHNLVYVEYAPSLLRRLLGEHSKAAFAIPVADIGGGRKWLWDHTARDVDHGRVRPIIGPAIERAIRQARGIK